MNLCWNIIVNELKIANKYVVDLYEGIYFIRWDIISFIYIEYLISVWFFELSVLCSLFIVVPIQSSHFLILSIYLFVYLLVISSVDLVISCISWASSLMEALGSQDYQ